MNDWDAEAELAELPEREVVYRTAPDPEATEKVAQALRGAERPAIVAGAGVGRTGSFEGVVSLAERLGAGVWQDPIPAFSGFPQNHSLFMGHLAPAQRQLAEQLSGYDVVLVLGAPVFQYYPYVPGPVVQEGTRVVQITDDPEEAARAATGTSIVGDVALSIETLLNSLPESSGRETAAPDGREEPPEPEAAYPISVEYLMYTLAGVLPEGVTVVDESISSKSKLSRYVKVDVAGGYHTSAAGGLGFGMPASVGLKLAAPEKPVVCVIGDGSTMYSVQALWSAAQYGADVTFVVINNKGYSILKGFREALDAGEEVPGLELPGLDFVKIAEGLGLRC